MLKEQLLNPKKCIEKPLNEHDIFVRATSWLLSLAGFSVIFLGRRYEKLREPETSFEIGSADIIAYRENEYLLLVDCDTKLPDEKKISSLLTLKEYFRFIQDKYEKPRIHPVIFSLRDCKELMGKYKEISIVDRSRIKWLLENAMLGKVEEIRFYLATGNVYDV